MANKMILHIPVKPEKRNEFIGIMKEAIADTRAFSGCLEVSVWTPEDDAGKVMVWEVWESKEHQEKYFAWRVETGMLEQLGDFLAGELVVTWLEEHE